MPPELFFAMLEALGGSFTATMSDLVRYDPHEHYMEIVKSADPPALSARLNPKNPAEEAPNTSLDKKPGSCICPPEPGTFNMSCPQHGLVATGRKCDCFFDPHTMQRTHKDSCKVHNAPDPDDSDYPF